ncbi:MAG TPA: hypothetical protein VHK69_14460 [Chitinophagaceae bacterium]|jgi:hypothetical protein|nr:hypothetical protein [Chitinophagaceae bacterium]
MNKTLQKRVSIFLSVDRETINDYFNPHDPSPVYKRQLRQDFVGYLLASVTGYRRDSQLQYKITCGKGDRELIDPLMQAIRNHFQQKEEAKQLEFNRFRKRTFKLLFLSIAVVMICQLILANINLEEHGMLATLGHSLDIFGWVVLWNPIDRLVFMWNPFLKELSLLHKMSTCEVLVIENSAVEVNPKMQIRA